MPRRTGLRGNSQTNRVIDSDNEDKDVGTWISVSILSTQHEEVQQIQKVLLSELDLDVTDLDICVKAMKIGLKSIKDVLRGYSFINL